jgi:hypothetical protein
MSGDDRDLRRLFDEAREADLRGAPPFRTTWELARRRAPRGPAGSRRPLFWLRWAGATAALAAAAVFVATRYAPRVAPIDLEREIALAQEISDWREPTAMLASLAGMEPLDEMPGLSLTSVGIPADTGFSSSHAMETQFTGGPGGAAPEGDRQ